MGSCDPKEKGRRLYLDDIEHRIHRPQFGDPRLQAAVHCASCGRPPLRPEPDDATTLERQLTEDVRSWLMDRSRNDRRVVRGVVRGVVGVSRVFDGSENEFGDGDRGVVDWIVDQLEEGPRSAALRAAGPGGKVRYLDDDSGIDALPEPR
jgi:hypothetical protein